MIRPRSPYPPMHLIQSGRIRAGGPKGPPNGARMSPPLRHMPMFYRMPSPTAGLIRVTPRHLPPTAYRMNMSNRPRMLTPSPIQNQRYSCITKIWNFDTKKFIRGLYLLFIYVICAKLLISVTSEGFFHYHVIILSNNNFVSDILVWDQ